jgi:hypothetical protein
MNDDGHVSCVRRRGPAALLAVGCLWFAALALVRPRRMAEILKADERLVRALGVRDLVSGASLLAARDPRVPLAARIVFDLGDVATFARRRPSMAGVAALYAALGLLALRAARR